MRYSKEFSSGNTSIRKYSARKPTSEQVPVLSSRKLGNMQDMETETRKHPSQLSFGEKANARKILMENSLKIGIKANEAKTCKKSI